MQVKSAVPCQAFDVNRPLSTAEALAFKNAGYECAIRYLPRTSSLLEGNLTGVEIEAILAAGLSLMAVQHVGLPAWHPTAALGSQYGLYAGMRAAEIGLPTGVSVWLDLEEVATESTPEQVIDYCNNWYLEVESHGYLPGIYVGYGTGISDAELYSLRFKNYWRAYNCDQSIPTRGYQVLQHPQKMLNGIAFDPNTIQKDEMGDLPYWASPI